MEGDVIAIEPGIENVPGIGGVRVEDLLLITADGAETLTDYPYGLTPSDPGPAHGDRPGHRPEAGGEAHLPQRIGARHGDPAGHRRAGAGAADGAAAGHPRARRRDEPESAATAADLHLGQDDPLPHVPGQDPGEGPPARHHPVCDARRGGAPRFGRMPVAAVPATAGLALLVAVTVTTPPIGGVFGAR